MTTASWLCSIVLSLALASAGDPADEKSGEAVPLPEQQAETAARTVYGWVFGDVNAGAARKQAATVAAQQRLDTLLQKKLEIVDGLCGLTDAQKQKLELAGRGDNKGLIDRIDDIAMRFNRDKNDPVKSVALWKETKPIQRGVIRPGLSTDYSLFVKSLEQLLTPEQTIKYAPLRAVFRAGGLVQTWQRGADEVFQINLTGTAFTDDDLAHLTEWSESPILYALNLAGTKVTDAGLEYLRRLPKLEMLVLSNTKVTDAGLVHLNALTGLQILRLNNTHATDVGLSGLKGLTALRELRLKGTQVTDAGVAELQRALPGLTINR
jgi:hypothetical protein